MATERTGDPEDDRRAMLGMAGDRAARDAAVEAYMPLVVKVAMGLVGCTGMELRDMVQEGAIGLMWAWRNRDPARAGAFPEFARTKIRGAILNAMPRHAGPIYVPKQAAGEQSWPRLTRVPLEPHDERMGRSDPLPPEEDERLPRLRAAMGRLTPGQRATVELRYGLTGLAPMPFRDIAAATGRHPATAHERHGSAMRRLGQMMAV